MVIPVNVKTRETAKSKLVETVKMGFRVLPAILGMMQQSIKGNIEKDPSLSSNAFYHKIWY